MLLLNFGLEREFSTLYASVCVYVWCVCEHLVLCTCACGVCVFVCVSV